jgi:hypothetical protein
MPDFGRWTSNGGDPSLNEINRADRFFEALAAKQPVYATDPAEAELSFLLSGWRDDVRDAPVTSPVGLGDAVRALESGRARSRGSRRSFAVVGSVAAAMLCIGGFGTAVYGAGPGDSLYGMRSAIFGTQEATRNEQVSLASAQLQQVQQLIDNGQWQEAQDKLVAVSNTVQSVDAPVESKQQLVEQWNALTYKVVEQDPAATLPPPGEPMPVLPSSPLTWLPVPVVENTPTSTTSASVSSSETTPGSDSAVTSTSGSTPSSEVPSMSPSDGATTPSSPSSGPSTVSSPSSSTSSTSAAPVPPPSSASATTVPPSSTTTATTTAATTTTTTTTTTTVPTHQPEATQQQSSASQAPESLAPQPRGVSSASVAPPAAASSAPAAPSVSVQPTQGVTPTPPAERPSVAPTTTTILPGG